MEPPNRPSVLMKNENRFKEERIIHRSFQSCIILPLHFILAYANIIQELFPFILRTNSFSIGFKFTITYLTNGCNKFYFKGDISLKDHLKLGNSLFKISFIVFMCFGVKNIVMLVLT